MFRKIHWSIPLLAVLFIGVGGFVYWQLSSVQQLKDNIAQDKPVEDKQINTKSVQHDDPFHEVPIDAPDKSQEESFSHHTEVNRDILDKPNMEIVNVTQYPKYDGKLTFEAYHNNLSQAWETSERDRHGLLKQSLPQPPKPNDFINEKEYLQSSKTYIALMRVEAENVLNILEESRSVLYE